MKKTPKILPTFYKSKGTLIFRDTTALPFEQGGLIHFERSEYGSDAREHYADGGPIKPPEVNFNYNPYNYNPNELVGYRGYGDLSGTSIEASTLDLLGRQNKVNALKVPLSVSVNKLYDPNTVNDTINYGYESTNIAASGIPGSVMQEEAQKQLDSAYQPYLSKSPLGFNIQTGVAGSGINPSIKKRSRYEMLFSGGYNPLSGFNAGVNTKLAFAAGNDFYRPLKKGDWRVAGNIQPFGMQFSQAPAYSEMQDVIQENLQNTAETGEFNPTMPGFNGYSGKGYGSGARVTFGAGLDAEVKLPLGTLVGGAEVKYNRAAGEAERLAPSAYLGYSIAGSELSNLGNKLPNINLPNRNKSNYETLAGQDLESEKGEWVQDAEGKFIWKDYPGFNGAFNASTLEGEDVYVPSQIADPEAAPITIPLGEGTNQLSGGGPIYTYSKRPGSYYQRADDGSWMINNSSTGGQYVPIDDPTGQRAALLNKYAKPQPGINKIYADPLSRNSETTQAVAAKTVPQSAGERANVEGARQDIAQRKANLEKVLMTQGKTPEQAASIVGSYGSDWTALEANNARALDTMANRAESIQSGDTPDKMLEYSPRPEQSAVGFAKDVLFNPFTAAGYAVRGQEIPDYMGEKIDNGTLGYYSNGQFIEGRNALDTATDIATPIGWAHSGYNIGEKALNNKSGDFWTEENAWDALNVAPGIGLAAKGMKYVPLANRVKFAPKSTASNLAVDAGSIARESSYAPQRPNLLHLGISPEQQELLNLQQVNNTTMLSSVAPAKKLKLYGENYKSPEELPTYMTPYLYSQEEIARRMTPYQQALMKMNELEKAADRVIKRTTDDKVYYDTEGNVIKTPADNLARGGFLNPYLFGGRLNKNC